MAAIARTIPALAIAQPILAALATPGATGRVLAAYDRSCYIETGEGRLIAVLAEPLGRGAFAITVGGTPSFANLRPDQALSLTGQMLQLGDHRIDLTMAVPWDPTVPSLAGPGDQGMRVLAAHLRANAPAEGLAGVHLDPGETPETPLLAQGRGALNRLYTGLTQGDAAAITGATAQLAGLGPGLTPSGDDVLAGILLALRLWPGAAGPLGPKVVGALLIGTAAPRTGRISRAYLWAASRRQASEAWHDLIRALPADPDAVITAATRILEIGETSGADMLTGFLFAGEFAGMFAGPR
ncbi:MAG: DUF2877 domain-containing protein [Armatimonadetes bacterium]|nr:DUF2877 domain-containing protein [Armatimonadota bacterium]